MNLNEKVKLLELVDLECLTISCSDKIFLITILCEITHQQRKKNPHMKVMDVVDKIVKDKLDQYQYQYAETISSICELLLKGNEKDIIDVGGDLRDKALKVLTILEAYVPF